MQYGNALASVTGEISPSSQGIYTYFIQYLIGE